MTETRPWATSARPQLTATIKRGNYGMWFVRLAGSGYPSERVLDTPRYAERMLSELVEDGFAIADPEHYCELYDILATPQGAEDSRDAAEGPALEMVGRGPGDDGRGVVVAEIGELDF